MAAVAPRMLREVPAMGPGRQGRVYDWRGTGLLPPSGGTIRPLILVEHIPVVPNRPGTADFIQLANVLRAQGLSLQCATDSEGNVALFNRMDRLCYQARGANSVSAGTEHMHLTVGEAWSKWQMRAAAWIAAHAHRVYGIPVQTAKLGAGHGVVSVLRRGHTSHRRVSQAAGYNDRVDPGAGFDWAELYELTRLYLRRGRF